MLLTWEEPYTMLTSWMQSIACAEAIAHTRLIRMKQHTTVHHRTWQCTTVHTEYHTIYSIPYIMLAFSRGVSFSLCTQYKASSSYYYSSSVILRGRYSKNYWTDFQYDFSSYVRTSVRISDSTFWWHWTLTLRFYLLSTFKDLWHSVMFLYLWPQQILSWFSHDFF